MNEKPTKPMIMGEKLFAGFIVCLCDICSTRNMCRMCVCFLMAEGTLTTTFSDNAKQTESKTWSESRVELSQLKEHKTRNEKSLENFIISLCI